MRVLLWVVFVTCTSKNNHSTITIDQLVIKYSLTESVSDMSYIHKCTYRSTYIYIYIYIYIYTPLSPYHEDIVSLV